MLDAVIKGILMGLYMAISVGPTLFAVIKYSMDYSYKAGLAFVLGVSLSDILYVTIANVAAGLLKQLHQYADYISYGGGILLMLVGVAGAISKIKPRRTNKGDIIPISGGRYLKIWAGGFLINTINPGVIVTWLGAVTITATKTGMYRFVMFGTCLTLILTIDFMKVFLADRIRQMLTPRRLIWVQRLSSIIIGSLGLLLLVTTAYNHYKK